MSVIDISSLDPLDIPKEQKFLVDTNILLFLHTDYSEKNPHRTDYANFVSDLIAYGIKLYTTTGNLQEMLNKIIRKEEELYAKQYQRTHPSEKSYKKKARLDPNARSQLQNIATVAAQQVYNTYEVVQTDLTQKTINGYLKDFSHLTYDVMDYFIAQTASNYNLHNIITSDPDFRCDERFNIFCFKDTAP